ncbi:hypothetical protein CPB97_004540 [Podila verticillata]|nr:hypothetical protein CPB97_004540 [Podila verticillata]
MGTTNSSPKWIAKYGVAQVPIFEGTGRAIIFESGAIAHYLGKNLAKETRIQQWTQFVDVSIGPTLGRWVFPLIRPTFPYNKAVETDAIVQVKDKLKILEQHFAKNTYIVGELVTLADISAITTLHNGFRLVFDPTFRKEYLPSPVGSPQLLTNPMSRPSLATLCSVRLLKSTTHLPRKGKKRKSPRRSAGRRKKPKEKDEDEEESFQDALRPESKLDLLPAAKMPLDEWKRQYSNNDPPVAMKWLWENIDFTADYSFWKVDYKFSDKPTKIYMSSSLASGLLNRLERARNWVKVKADDAEKAKID